MLNNISAMHNIWYAFVIEKTGITGFKSTSDILKLFYCIIIISLKNNCFIIKIYFLLNKKNLLWNFRLYP